MIAVPAVDLREGACVQLVGGRYDAERVRLPDPEAVAQSWRVRGFAQVHVVDLDAATGRGDNRPAIDRILERLGSGVQVGGGMSRVERVDEILALGADRVVVGTRAIEEPAWLAETARARPGRIVVAADVEGESVVTRGWSRSAGRTLTEVLAELEPLPLAGILVTAVHLEGRLQGPDLELTRLAARSTRHPIQASGGIRNLDDLRALADAGASRAVIGMALYTGLLDPEAVAKEFGQ